MTKSCVRSRILWNSQPASQCRSLTNRGFTLFIDILIIRRKCHHRNLHLNSSRQATRFDGAIVRVFLFWCLPPRHTLISSRASKMVSSFFIHCFLVFSDIIRPLESTQLFYLGEQIEYLNLTFDRGVTRIWRKLVDYSGWLVKEDFERHLFFWKGKKWFKYKASSK